MSYLILRYGRRGWGRDGDGRGWYNPLSVVGVVVVVVAVVAAIVVGGDLAPHHHHRFPSRPNPSIVVVGVK